MAIVVMCLITSMVAGPAVNALLDLGTIVPVGLDAAAGDGSEARQDIVVGTDVGSEVARDPDDRPVVPVS